MRVVAKALGISVLRVMKLASLQMPSRIGMVEALSNMKVMRLHGMDHGVMMGHGMVAPMAMIPLGAHGLGEVHGGLTLPKAV